MLFILFTMLFRFSNPRGWYFFRVLQLLRLNELKQLFWKPIVKDFLIRCLSVLLDWCCSSNISIVFFKQPCHISFKHRPTTILKYLGVFKKTNVFIYCYNTNATLLALLVLRVLSKLDLDVTSTLVNTYLVVSNLHSETKGFQFKSIC